METSLHRALKERYASGKGERREVIVESFRIDAIDDAGQLIEVQSGPLGPLRRKLHALLPRHRVRVVKPLVLARRIVKKARRDGRVLSMRRRPEARRVH